MAIRGGGWEPVGLDFAGALAVTAAEGVAPEIAADLLAACAAGMREGVAERSGGK